MELSTVHYLSYSIRSLSSSPETHTFYMPICNCETYACGGKDVTPRAFGNHQREDKRRNFRQAYAKATQVCDKQSDDIVAYISSLTLSDSSTGGISAPGGHLWSHSVQEDEGDDDIVDYISSLTLSDSATGGTSGARLSSRSVQDDDTHSATGSNTAPVGVLRSTDTLLRSHRLQPSPRYAPINNALSELDDIEKALGSLLLTAGPQLKSLSTPLSRHKPFPLKSTISAARLLRDRLSSVTNKVPSVRKRKTNVTDSLSAFLEELMTCNTLWNKEMKRLAKKDNEIIPTYETSVCSERQLFRVTNCVLQRIILRLSYQMLTQLSRCRSLPCWPSKLSFISVIAVAISFSQCFDTSYNFP